MKNLYLLIAAFVSTTHLQPCDASQIQTSNSIQEAIHQFVVSNLSLYTEYSIKPGQLDQRLKLAQCSQALLVFTHNGSIKPGRNSIGVKCNGKKQWTLYNSTIVNIFEDVLVLAQPVRRGEIINKDALKLEKRNISTLRRGYLTHPNSVANKQATRNLNAGIIINKTNFSEPKLIKRGEKITIKTGTANLNISMAGIAMMDGIKGQNIKVKNIKSQQIVQATVMQSGQVIVLF